MRGQDRFESGHLRREVFGGLYRRLGKQEIERLSRLVRIFCPNIRRGDGAKNAGARIAVHRACGEGADELFFAVDNAAARGTFLCRGRTAERKHVNAINGEGKDVLYRVEDKGGEERGLYLIGLKKLAGIRRDSD